MKRKTIQSFFKYLYMSALVALVAVVTPVTAQTLLEEDFSSGFEEWTVVHPPGAFNGSTRWQVGASGETLFENSNVRAPGSAGMLINEAKTGENYTYKALLMSGDDDGIGLVFGYKDASNFYRIMFASQEERNTFPGEGWLLERVVDGSAIHLGGDDYSEDWEPDFIYIQGYPFEVTIKTKGKKLTITVVDDPEEDGTEYELVSNLTIPADADGNVGLASWEQAGGIPSGSHFSDISVDGKEVAIPNPLEGWEEVIPLNYEENDFLEGGNEGIPLWSVGITTDSVAGGILTESSNSGLAGIEIEGVDEEFYSNLDWVSGMLVKGDAKWKDYRISTKLHPYPHCAFTGCWVNGHGVVFRYKDPENFYRLSFSSRNPGDGLPRQGVSIQKVVNGEWSEVFWEKGAAFSSKKFVPSGKADQSEFNLNMSIVGNQLEFSIVNDPDGMAKVFNYGPIEITGVDSGKVGFFSWYQHKLDIHHIKVEEIAGMPFEVFSNFGKPSPPAGLTNFEPGTKVLATVPSPIVDPPGFRRKVTGWSGTGSAPKGGIWFLPGNPRLSFVINQASSLTWNWKTEVKVNITADGGGKVTGGSSKWYKEGSKLIVTAVPSTGNMFDGWYGAVASKERKLTVYTDRPLDLIAAFRPDSDRDKMDDDWEKKYIGNLNEQGSGDFDGDGVSNMDEYRRRTNPAAEEELVYEVPSNWKNPNVSNPYTVGRMVVADFGKGYSGIWENSGTGIAASSDEFEFIDWRGPKVVLKDSVWEEDWKDGVYEATFVVGDSDTSCIYFRYQDEDNWYRASISGREGDGIQKTDKWGSYTVNGVTAAQIGLTIQKKVNGVYQLIEEYDDYMIPDPEDDTLKIIKLKVSANGNSFKVQAIPYDPINLKDFDDDEASEEVSFNDEALATGCVGVGFAYQGNGFNWCRSCPGGPADTATENIPVGSGVLLNDLSIQVNEKIVFRDSWILHDTPTGLPVGWFNPFASQEGSMAGEWVPSAHGGFIQMSPFFLPSLTKKDTAKADGEGPVLLAPLVKDQDFVLELGLLSHNANNLLTTVDGLGFVYDYIDENNFARVLFVNPKALNLEGGSTIPRGINISRKIQGQWRDIIVGDLSFTYQRGRPFDVAFTAEKGNYHLVIKEHDPMFVWNSWERVYVPATPNEIKKGPKSAELHWSDKEITSGTRYGLTTWGSRYAHFLHARAYSLDGKNSQPSKPPVLAVSRNGNKVSITWEGEGTLESAEQIGGPWSEVRGVSSPTTVQPVAKQGYYRLKR
tara:strand:- start:138 stop:3911 length:3774 start_codon:yes stop_codon:yes gene_type:complete